MLLHELLDEVATGDEPPSRLAADEVYAAGQRRRRTTAAAARIGTRPRWSSPSWPPPSSPPRPGPPPPPARPSWTRPARRSKQSAVRPRPSVRTGAYVRGLRTGV